MSDTEILDRIEKYGVSLWPDRESRTIPDSPISEWNTFCRNPNNKGLPIQVTCGSLRATLVATIEELEDVWKPTVDHTRVADEEAHRRKAEDTPA